MPAPHQPPAEATLPATSRAKPPPAGPVLLVVGAGRLMTVRFPRSGELVLGRDASCDVVLDHAEVSRRHAVVRAGSPPTVTDLGSTNGVALGEQRQPAALPMALGPDASFTLGPFHVQLVQPLAPPAGRAPRPPTPAAAVVVADPAGAADSPVLVRIAESAVNILILGETGVGKEVLARTLHRRSRREGRFVAINCAGLAVSLLDSELFGHERGAFTGATETRAGVFEAADGGTLFLDEVGELSETMQAKLLRALETRQVMRVGSNRPLDVDTRFVAATHRDLRDDVARGRFRRDLYYRLSGITLQIPPLRERPGAIEPLVATLLAGVRPPRPTIAAAALALLTSHRWPGNVRELRNVLERAALLSHDGEIRPEHILLEPTDPVATAPAEVRLDDERARVVAALEACAGNQTRAARLLGVSRATLVNRLERFAVARPRPRQP